MLEGIQRSLFLLILLLTMTIAGDALTTHKKSIDPSINQNEKALIKTCAEIWNNAKLA